MTWKQAKTVAVDPRIIPLGTKLLIVFEDPAFKKYNGIYVARDTGGAIKGYKIDFFLGDFGGISPKETADFGVQKAKVHVVK